MQISPIKNPNFEKPSRNLSNRTKVKILQKNFFGYLSKKIWFCVCSVPAEMFEHRNSGENRRKRSEFFFENLRRAYKDLIQVKKKFKIISCLCTFKVSKGKLIGCRTMKRFQECYALCFSLPLPPPPLFPILKIKNTEVVFCFPNIFQ